MKTALLIVLLWVTHFSFCQTDFEGIITYALRYEHFPEELDDPRSLFQSSERFTVKDTRTKIEHETIIGPAVHVIDPDKQSAIRAIFAMCVTIYDTLKPQNWRVDNDYTILPFQYVPDVQKVIAGINCQKAFQIIGGDTLTCWYTRKFGGTRHPGYPQLEGFPLAYERTKYGGLILTTATTVDRKSIPEDSITQALSDLFPARLHGTVQEDNQTPIRNAALTLKHDGEIVHTIYTDEKGAFNVNFDVHVQDTFTLSVNHNYFFPADVQMVVDSRWTNDFELNLELTRLLREFGPNSVKFEDNEIQPLSEFRADELKEVMEKYSNICIEFRHFSMDQESKRLVRKRMETFEKYLVEQGVPMSQLTFNYTGALLPLEATSDRRSRIEGQVLSLDGPCR